MWAHDTILGKICWMEMSRLEMAQRLFFFLICNGWFHLTGLHAAAEAGVRASSKSKNYMLHSNICSGQTPACFHLLKRKMGGGALFLCSTGFLTASVNTGPLKGHTVCHPWAPARSSPLININGHCTKWGHWLLTRGVEDGREGCSF